MFAVGVTIVISCMVAAIASAATVAREPQIERSNRIIGGEPVDISERPYLVQLRQKKFPRLFQCGGTLVGDGSYVVTAAHCLKGKTPVSDLVVVGGCRTIYDVCEQRNIVASASHEDYGVGHTYANDGAVLKLESILNGTNINPIRMSFEDVADEKFLQVSGWGTTEHGMTGTVKEIRTISVKKLRAKDCKEKYSYTNVTNSMICASLDGKDACQGDSGGPAVYGGQLAAIVSWGRGCALSEYPGVYTSLRSMEKFIKKYVINKN